MNLEWRRIAKDYLFETSINDKANRQVTLLQSWKKIVAIVTQDNHRMIRTDKHYSYDVNMSLDKLCRTQRLKCIILNANEFYELLVSKLGKEMFFQNLDGDVSISMAYEDGEEGEDYETDDTE